MLRRFLLLSVFLTLAVPAVAGEFRVLVGPETSTRYGESGVGVMLVSDFKTDRFWAEGQVSTIDKYTKQGWRSSVSAGLTTGVLLAGLGYSHRNGGEWAKDVIWARLGATHKFLTAIAQIAPESDNREIMVEVRARGKIKVVEVEARTWVGDHVQAEGGYAYGVQFLLGWSHAK